jgi:hypothetical protein
MIIEKKGCLTAFSVALSDIETRELSVRALSRGIFPNAMFTTTAGNCYIMDGNVGDNSRILK